MPLTFGASTWLGRVEEAIDCDREEVTVVAWDGPEDVLLVNSRGTEGKAFGVFELEGPLSEGDRSE